VFTFIKAVYRLAFTNYFFAMRRPGQIILVLAWVAGCAIGSYFALPVGQLSAIATPIALTVCLIGIWAYIGSLRQRGSL